MTTSNTISSLKAFSKVKLQVVDHDGYKVALISVDGIGEIEVHCLEDYPEVFGDEAVVTALDEWAMTQPKEKTPWGDVETDPIYMIWEALKPEDAE